jgi:transposase
MDPSAQPSKPVTTEELLAVIAAQQAQIATLMARVAELERRLGLNSTNSSKPSSSDGLNKPPRRTSSMRQASGKKTGGQEGHEGKTLRQVDSPDKVIDHYPEQCQRCSAALSEDMAADYQKRQVFDLPEPQPLQVTEHRAHVCCCSSCGTKTAGLFPEDVTAAAQYGAALTATIVYLQIQHHIPEDRVVEIMHDLFKIDLAAGTVGAMVTRRAESFADAAAAIGDRVRTTAVKHMDETGLRVGGKTLWLHVASTCLLTFYRVAIQRGAMMSDVIGTIVHDCWGPYFKMANVSHALCNAHLLRELQALMDFEKEPWAFAMSRFLRQACHAVHLAQERKTTLKPSFVQYILARYDCIVSQGLAFHAAQAPPEGRNPAAKKRRGRTKKRVGHNLVIRMRDHRESVLRFITDPAVPFTNNQAEQDVRMMKVRLKVSGGFRSMTGAESFAILRSVISTARKQGIGILDALTQDPAVFLQKLRVA